MLQSIFRRTVYENLPTIFTAKCSTISEKTIRKEINQVTLIGTVHWDQLTNVHGQKLIYIKTIDSVSQKYQIHTLYTSVPQDYEAGKRIFVGGSLISKELITSDNKRRQQSIIKAYQIYELNPTYANNPNAMDDMNAVELLTTVCADVIENYDHTIITVVTHFVNRSNQERRPSFHSIFVFEPNLCDLIRNNIAKSDRIYVRGSLRTQSHIDNNGKKLRSGFIVAETIDKLAQFYQNRPSTQESAKP